MECLSERGAELGGYTSEERGEYDKTGRNEAQFLKAAMQKAGRWVSKERRQNRGVR